MAQQSQQELTEKIEVLQTEIQSLEQQLEALRIEKANYCNELSNDPDARMRRLEQLASGFAVEHVREFTDEQLGKVKQFMDSIRAVENTIRSHYHTIEQTQTQIAEQQRREAAEQAIKPLIKDFNGCLNVLQQKLQDLKAIADEHDIELLLEQTLPGNAELFQEQGYPGHHAYRRGLNIRFDD